MNNESSSGGCNFKNGFQIKNEEIWSLESLQNKGSMLSERELINGKPSEVSPSLVEYDVINPQTFFTLFNRYMLSSAKLYVSYVPKEKGQLIAATDNIREWNFKPFLLQH